MKEQMHIYHQAQDGLRSLQYVSLPAKRNSICCQRRLQGFPWYLETLDSMILVSHASVPEITDKNST